MPQKTLFDLSSESLDLYFADQIPHLTPEAKDGLPRDIVFKLFRRGGDFNSKSTSKLNFLAKLYVLWRALNKRWWIVIEDENRGLTPGQFMELRKVAKERDYSMDQAQTIVLSGTLVLGTPELCQTLSYLNRLSTAPSYNYLVKSKNPAKNHVAESEKQAQYIVRFLIHWEGSKKNMVAQTGLNIPEVLVLLALYHGKEVQGATLYHGLYKRAYQSSPTKIKAAFRSLQNRGYINKFGATSDAMLQITALGKDVLRGILDKYAINC